MRGLLGLLAGLVLVGVLYVGWTQRGAPEVRVDGQGRAPAFHLEDDRGSAVASTDLRGRPALLAFLAVDNGASLRQGPALSRWGLDHGVRVVGIAVGSGGAAELAELRRSRGLDFEIARADQALLREYDVLQVPAAVLLDADGRVLRTRAGALNAVDLWWWGRGL